MASPHFVEVQHWGRSTQILFLCPVLSAFRLCNSDSCWWHVKFWGIAYLWLRDHAHTRAPNPGRWFAGLTALWNRFLGFVKGASLMQLERFHLMLFFLFGSYLQFSHRLAGVRYLFLRKLSQERPGYQVLGVLMLFQFVLGSVLAVKHYISERRKSARPEGKEGEIQIIASDEDEEDPNANCGLCFCPRSFPTVTECGHLFCWHCICECLTNKPECPMCRQPCAVSALVRLNNYRKGGVT